MRVSDLVNLMLLVLMSPLIGSEEAVKLIGGYTKLTRAGKLLLTMARHYEQSGISYDAYFEFLMQRFSNIIEDWGRMSNEINISVLMLTMVLVMIEALVVMLVSINAIEVLTVVMPLLLVPLIHVNQLKMYDYDYLKPTMTGTTSSIAVYLITHNSLYTITAFSLGFAVLYMPQFLGFVRLIMNLEHRVMEPILELTWNPTPREIIGSSIIEREFSRIRDIAYSIGAPYFIAKAIRVMDSVIFRLKTMFRDNVIYGALIPINYVALVEFAEFINGALAKTAIEAAPNLLFNYHVPPLILLASAVTSAVLTGKVVHSLGLGLSIIFIFTIPLLIITPH